MADGTKVVLGLWLEQNESAKFWLRVMNELRNRSVEDIMLAVVDGLKAIYRAVDAAAAEEALTAFEASFWGQRYPAIGQSWRRAWPEVIPFFAFPDEVRRIVYTTNAMVVSQFEF